MVLLDQEYNNSVDIWLEEQRKKRSSKTHRNNLQSGYIKTGSFAWLQLKRKRKRAYKEKNKKEQVCLKCCTHLYVICKAAARMLNVPASHIDPKEQAG